MKETLHSPHILTTINETIQRNRAFMIVEETPEFYFCKKEGQVITRRSKSECSEETRRRQGWWNQEGNNLLSHYLHTNDVYYLTTQLVGSTAYGTCIQSSDIDILVAIDDLAMSSMERYKTIQLMARSEPKLCKGFQDLCVQFNCAAPAKIDLRMVLATSLLK